MTTLDTTQPTSAELFAAYRPSPTGYDEFCSETGQPRPQWNYLAPALGALGATGLQQRQQDARRLLRDNGVSYNIMGDVQELDRPWQLDPIPLPIASDEWRSIERGLLQRAELLRCVLRDLYGPRELFRKGILPPELVYSQPGFLRPCMALPLVNERYALPLYAADLARTANGATIVINDRTQAPPGAGYALENRLVLSRVLPSLFRDAHVHRLALYFRTLRNTLSNMAWRRSDEVRIVVFSPGSMSETYFEHAFLARYLGYTLVEGADLTVRDGQVWLKTLDGLQTVDVILRFVDDVLCDPLELRQDSAFGVAGLLQAVRSRSVSMANPLGSGVLENPALAAFLPTLAQYFLGEQLLLASPPTYWCGLAQQCDHVLANLDTLVIQSTLHTSNSAPLIGSALDQQQRAQLRHQILAQPYHYSAQEPVKLSTMPVFTAAGLQPRPLVLRSFLVATDTDYLALPGGLARVAGNIDDPVASVQDGGISKDTWLLASEPIQQVSLLPTLGQHPQFVKGQGELPSRVAENLFWLGRYSERGESIIRLLRVVLLNLLEPDEIVTEAQNQACLQTLLRALTHLTLTYPGFVGEGAAARLAQPDEELLSIFLDPKRNGSLSNNLNALLYAARSVRDRISPDMWRVINSIDDGLQQLQTRRTERLGFSGSERSTLNSALDTLNQLLTAFAAFTGLAIDSMTHGQGWRFLLIGRRLERAQQTLPLLRVMLVDATADAALLLEALLSICDSLMTYRSRYRSQVQAGATLDLLLLDETNPRSLSYQLRHIHDDLHTLPGSDRLFPYKTSDKRLALKALTSLRLAEIERLAVVSNDEPAPLHELLDELADLLSDLSDAITASYFRHTDRPKQLVRFAN